jgi:20S proteasome alpha/beta subunit
MRCTPFKVLMAHHRGDDSVLYHIDVDGTWNEITTYMAIGSGSSVANTFCAELDHDNITIKEFTRRAYLAIKYMEHYCRGLGVGIESRGHPDIKYLFYDKEKDYNVSEDDIKEYKQYSEKKLELFKQSFDSILNE